MVNLCDLVNPVFTQFGDDFGRVMDPVPHQTGKGSSKDDKIVTLARARRGAGRIYVWRGLIPPPLTPGPAHPKPRVGASMRAHCDGGRDRRRSRLCSQIWETAPTVADGNRRR